MATVTNTITLPDGSTPVHAAVEIDLVASTNVTHAAGWVTATDVTVLSTARPTVTTGAWSADLTPNANLTPAGTVYRVTEYVGRARYVHYISVSVGGGSVFDLLVESPTSIDTPPLRVAAVAHGVDPTVARPDTTASVMWVGAAEPDDVLAGDVWVQAAWSPTDDTTLELWLDASKRSSITHVAGAVSQWSDLSGNARHAVQATSGAKPTTGIEQINGLNALSFDGGDHLTGASIAVTQDRTTYAVVAANAHDQTRRVIIEASAGGTFMYGQLQMEVSDADCATTITNNSAGTMTVASRATTALPVLDPVIVVARRADSSSLAIYQGITLMDSDALTGEVDETATAFVIGKQRDASARWWKGLICEIADFSSAHDDAERNVVVNYLAAKWGASV